MANIQWPAGVEYRTLIDGYNLDSPTSPVEKSDMDAGNVRMRRKYTVTLSKETVQIRMKTEAMYELFRIWHRDTLQHGSAKFDMPVWVNGSYQTRTCYMEDGQFTAVPSGLGRLVQFTRNVEEM